MLGGHVRVAELLSPDLGVCQHPGKRPGKIRLADRGPLRRGQLGNRALRGCSNDSRVSAGSCDQGRDGIAGHLQQRVQQMRRLGVRVALRQCSAQRSRDSVTTL